MYVMSLILFYDNGSMLHVDFKKWRVVVSNLGVKGLRWHVALEGNYGSLCLMPTVALVGRLVQTVRDESYVRTPPTSSCTHPSPGGKTSRAVLVGVVLGDYLYTGFPQRLENLEMKTVMEQAKLTKSYEICIISHGILPISPPPPPNCKKFVCCLPPLRN